jgi:hypothetical protein
MFARLSITMPVTLPDYASLISHNGRTSLITTLPRGASHVTTFTVDTVSVFIWLKAAVA